jgi:mRNA degradation ribonuclease J1/J2
MSTDTVVISKQRLLELEALAASLPDAIEKAVEDYKRKKLEKLHARDKANPEAVKERVRRYAQKNRDLINQKLREKRAAAKSVSAPSQCKKLEESETAAVANWNNQECGAVLQF